jgi:hypothetical protein
VSSARGRWARWLVIPLIAGALPFLVLLSILAGTIVSTAGACQPSGQPTGGQGPTQVAGVPSWLLPIYEQAAGKYKLRADGWAYLAAINKVETSFGQDLSVSSAGAIGWMQFMPGTWTQYGESADPGKPGAPPDPYDPWDAIFAAAHLLRSSGAPSNWSGAIFAYNHAGWYVAEVTGLAQQFLAAAGGSGAPQPSLPVQATGGAAPGLITDPGGLSGATIYGNAHDDNGLGAYQGESLAGDFKSGSPPYAELGGPPETSANLLGHLPPGTALRITNPANGQSITAYKHDWGHGQGNATLQGHRYRIDLWWQTAYAIGIHDSALVKLELVGAGTQGADCGGATTGTVPGSKAKIQPDGTALAPTDAPPAVKAMIAAGNRIDHFTYSFGGGHGTPDQTMNQAHPDPGAVPGAEEHGGPGYDCSSATSYVLWGGGFGQSLLGGGVPDSSTLEGMGDPGPGKWVTWYATAGHAYIEVAGIFFDTNNAAQNGGVGRPPNPPPFGPRWTPVGSGPSGYVARHPAGL